MFRLGMWVGLGGAGTVCHMGGCSRLLMWLVVVVLFTLAFDSSPIKGEGIGGWIGLLLPGRVTTPLDCGSSPQ